jgi:hypothetical protein
MYAEAMITCPTGLPQLRYPLGGEGEGANLWNRVRPGRERP